MKRQTIFFLISLVSMILGSCTLSMEEWITPEEERGVYEPYTYKDSIIDITYQYNDGVKPITKNVMEYFAAVESGKILYFKDNVPSEWLPEEGGFVQIGCNEVFPLGYMGKVLRRSKANGFIRLETTGASIKEIYKQLKYIAEGPLKFDIPEDYDPNDYEWATDTMPEEEIDFGPEEEEWETEVDDESALSAASPMLCVPSAAPTYPQRRVVSRHSAQNQKVTEKKEEKYYIDYSLVKDQVPELYKDQMLKHFPQKFARLSRGDEPKDSLAKDEIALKIKFQPPGLSLSINDVELGAKFPAGEVLKKELSEKYKDFASASINIGGYLEFKNSSSKTFHVEYDDDEDYEKNVVIDKQTSSTNFVLGVESEGQLKTTDSKGKCHKAIRQHIKKSKNKTIRKGALIHYDKYVLIYPPLALCLKVAPEFGLEYNFNLAGEISQTTTTETVSGYIKKNGKKKEIREKPTTNFNVDINAFGSFALGLYAQMYIGLELAHVIGSGGTIKVSGGVEGSFSTDNDIPGSDFNTYSTDNNYLKPYVKIGGNIKFYVGKQDDPIFEGGLDFPTIDFLEDSRWYLEPKASAGGKILDAVVKEYTTTPHFIGSYNVTDKGLYPWTGRYEPRMRLYEWTNSTKPFVATQNNLSFFGDYPVAELPADKSSILYGSKYNFDDYIPALSSPYYSYVAVPCLYNSLYGTYLLFPKLARHIEMGNPNLKVLALKQTKGRPLKASERKEFGIHTNHVNEYNLYEFAAVVHLTNGTKVSMVYFPIDIYNNKTGKIQNSGTYEFYKTYATGYYIYIFRFVSNLDPYSVDGPVFSVGMDPGFLDNDNTQHRYPVSMPYLDLDLIYEDVDVGYKGTTQKVTL